MNADADRLHDELLPVLALLEQEAGDLDPDGLLTRLAEQAAQITRAIITNSHPALRHSGGRLLIDSGPTGTTAVMHLTAPDGVQP